MSDLSDEERAALTVMRESRFYYVNGLRPHALCAGLAERGFAFGERSPRSEYLPLTPYPDRYRILRAGEEALRGHYSVEAASPAER